MTEGKVRPLSEVAEECRRLRQEGRRVVFTNGCFDLLHVGHVQTVESARALGDYLVVGINSDASVRRLKGPSRPLVAQEDRARLLAALAAVDAVVVFDDATPTETLEQVRPDVHVKGGDYRGQVLPEQATVEAHGGVVRFIPLVPGRSTSRLVELLQHG